ncbi:UDP-glucose--hexose-1-phosphate uridylyltransferase [Maribellus maritimus]|uniref:UDP-glucose--hexose-1-phosphate uridylyltransferase n=1 Tax=Maribellus maritimus TaxID=2870838 RepID=UPI001EEC215B|nr:UDP-glucose--hexose-1-phosphate uridylyltransferase [Maribellus maritimus]MCG6190134.1 UDP-glucose--hexose-1-phosphate uridylyltransferase [Maribellus maritimus]
MSFNIEEHPHKRYNPLNGDWILVSPHRAKRPWQGQVEKQASQERPKYEPGCYLCPGNERAGGHKNPDYNRTFVFTNDFSALLTDTPPGEISDGELFQAKSESGICKVICFSEDHSLTIPEMEVANIRNVVDLWCLQFEELGNNPQINYVQIFENKGAIMGCSNPHPHGQIWSSEGIPVEPEKESRAQKAYFEKHGRTLLNDYLQTELVKEIRVLNQNDSFVALVPFWAVWPFEAMIVSRRPVQNILQLEEKERTDLADIYKKLTIMYDNLFETSFAYSAGLHQAPTDGKDYPEWHLHMHFYPPLLRSATVKKFMVGYEMLATPQRDITPEQAAQRLRDLPKIHYKK